jgi:hypothetical protein
MIKNSRCNLIYLHAVFNSSSPFNKITLEISSCPKADEISANNTGCVKLGWAGGTA